VDGFSPIKRAEYSIDAGDWQYVEPVGQLSDYRVENYDFYASGPGATKLAADNAPPSAAADTADLQRSTRRGIAPPSIPTQEHVVVVRVYDRFDNMGAAKFVIHQELK
jgi:hypothetical protein